MAVQAMDHALFLNIIKFLFCDSHCQEISSNRFIRRTYSSPVDAK